MTFQEQAHIQLNAIDNSVRVSPLAQDSISSEVLND